MLYVKIGAVGTTVLWRIAIVAALMLCRPEPTECRTADLPRNSNGISPLDYVDSTIAATISTSYLENHHATQSRV